MFHWFAQLSPPVLALIATLFIWCVTSLGASLVFFFKSVHKTILDAMLGLAAGVMLSASFWSLLSPSIEMAEQLGMTAWLVTTAGFLCGGLLLLLSDKIFSFLDHRAQKTADASTSGGRRRCMMLLLSITLQNIPEGLVVGVAFGSLAYHLEGATLSAACLLALSVGLQNFPEGTAISVALRREGFSRGKAFFYGQLSGFAEPVAGITGALLAGCVQSWLPFLLSFAAGAMIYVAVKELIPESQTNHKKNVMAFFTLIGFSIMMILDAILS